MKQIRLSKGLYALVSAQDYDYLNQWKWSASFESRNTKCYAIRMIKLPSGKQKKIRMHRVIAERRFNENVRASGDRGFIPLDVNDVVDHLNHNSLDNRRENLEIVTQAENMRRSPGWKKREHGKAS